MTHRETKGDYFRVRLGNGRTGDPESKGRNGGVDY